MKDSPFSDVTPRYEARNLGTAKYRIEVSEDAAQEAKLLMGDLRLQASYGMWSGSAGVSFSKSYEKNTRALYVYIVMTKDYGFEVLADPSKNNLTAQAKTFIQNGQGDEWLEKYGSEIVTRMQRGAGVVITIALHSSSLATDFQFAADLQVKYKALFASGQLNLNFTQAVQTRLDQKQGSISAVIFGGNEASFTPPNNALKINDWITSANTYLSSMDQSFGWPVRYMTTSYKTFFNNNEKPFHPNPTDAYERLVNLSSKIASLNHLLEDSRTGKRYLTLAQFLYYEQKLSECILRQGQVLNFGRGLLSGDAAVMGQPVPPDVEIQWPKLWMSYEFRHRILPPLPTDTSTRYYHYWDLYVTVHGGTPKLVPHLYFHGYINNYYPMYAPEIVADGVRWTHSDYAGKFAGHWNRRSGEFFFVQLRDGATPIMSQAFPIGNDPADPVAIPAKKAQGGLK